VAKAKRRYERSFYEHYHNALVEHRYLNRHGPVAPKARLLPPRVKPPVRSIPVIQARVPADLYPFMMALRTAREYDLPASPGLLAEGLLWGLLHRPSREHDAWTLKALDLVDELLDAEQGEERRALANRGALSDYAAIDDFTVRLPRLLALRELCMAGDLGAMVEWEVGDVE
jgi:hypothetical protein